MSNNASNIFEEIIRLPLNVVMNAYNAHCPNPTMGIDKTYAANWLTGQIVSGTLNMNNIMNPPSAAAAPSNEVEENVYQILRDIDARAGNAISSMQNAVGVANQTAHNAEQIAKAANEQSQRITTGLNILQRNVESLTKSFEAVAKDVVDKLDGYNDEVKQIKVSESQVQAAVAKVVADAFEPFKRIVEEAGLEQTMADYSAIRIVESKSALEVFGIDIKDMKGDPVMVDCWNHPHSPAIDPNFIWHEPILRHLLLTQITGENLWFGGEKGTGKSETARQFAARTGRGYCRINFHKYTTTADYIGDKGLQNGNTMFEEADFLIAWRTPSTIILLDEITNCAPGELAPLNGLLEPNSAVSIGGAVRRRAPGVLVFAADNTLTNGDDTGRYAGTQQMNSALADRFTRLIRFEHMSREAEIDAVTRHTGCNRNLVEHVVGAVLIARGKVKTGDVIDAPSIRQTVGFLRALQMMPVKMAWDSTIADRQPVESAAALESIYATCLDKKLIQKHL